MEEMFSINCRMCSYVLGKIILRPKGALSRTLTVIHKPRIRLEVEIQSLRT
jgi:hypothetical protein